MVIFGEVPKTDAAGQAVVCRGCGQPGPAKTLIIQSDAGPLTTAALCETCLVELAQAAAKAVAP